MIDPAELKTLPFFRSLDDEAIAVLAPHTNLLTAKTGERVFEEGAPSDTLLVLVTGMVANRQHPIHGGEDILMNVVSRPGQVIGASALATADDAVHPFSAVCMEDSEFVVMPVAELWEAFEENPAVGLHLLARFTHMLAERLADAREQIRSRIRPGLISQG
ncbi:MAG: Crp/Fnr family transcriptional regulator [Actinobacteria bacterium]|nr:Crp/Fnr family transcriptional regulator [Actinomycetota bacterium]